MGYVLYLPSFQLPLIVGLGALVLLDNAPIFSPRSATHTVVMSALVWVLLMGWFWEPGAGVTTGITLLFLIGLETVALLKLARNGRRASQRVAIGVAVAAVAAFASPVVLLSVSCARGNCF